MKLVPKTIKKEIVREVALADNFHALPRMPCQKGEMKTMNTNLRLLVTPQETKWRRAEVSLKHTIRVKEESPSNAGLGSSRKNIFTAAWVKFFFMTCFGVREFAKPQRRHREGMSLNKDD